MPRLPVRLSPIDEELRAESLIDQAMQGIEQALEAFPFDIRRSALIRSLARVNNLMTQAAADDSEPDADDQVDEGTDVRADEADDEVEDEDNSRASIQDRIYELLVANPRLPIKELAEHIYNSDGDRARANVRSQLSAMKKSGRARLIEPGVWEAVHYE